MSYGYSSGAPTVTGDLKAKEDAQRDTLIDFGEDQIDFQTSGSVRLQITNTGVEALNGNFKGTLNGTASNAVMDPMGSNLVGGVFEIDQGLFQNPDPNYNPIYFPSDDSFTERVGVSSINYFIAPFDGELIKIQIRSNNTDFSSTSLTASLHVGVDGNNAYSSSPTATSAISGQGTHYTHTFDFMGTGATFSEGDVYGFALKCASGFAGTETIHFTTVVRYDPYSE